MFMVRMEGGPYYSTNHCMFRLRYADKNKPMGTLTCAWETLFVLLQHTNIDVQIPSEFVTPRLLADAEQAGFDVSVLQKRGENEKD